MISSWKWYKNPNKVREGDNVKYYLEDTDKVLRELESSEQGLSSGEAAASRA